MGFVEVGLEEPSEGQMNDRRVQTETSCVQRHFSRLLIRGKDRGLLEHIEQPLHNSYSWI